MEQGVDQRVVLVAGCRMHHQPRRLVQNQQEIVLEQNVERDFLGLRFGGPRFGPVHFDLFARVGVMRGLDGLAVDADVALLNQPLDAAARHRRELAAQVSIQSLRQERLPDGEGFGARRHESKP